MIDENTIKEVRAEARKEYTNMCTGFDVDETRIHEANGFLAALEWCLEERERPTYTYRSR